MTDSDFFTESDADDIFQQRENQRRAQVIDGQLYGPMLQGANVIFQQQPQQNESDSCMESSGVFTDVENRGEDELLNRIAENQAQHVNDMSPDLSSDTITSNGTAYSQKKLMEVTESPTQQLQEFLAIERSSSMCSGATTMEECVNLISNETCSSAALGCSGTKNSCDDDKQQAIVDSTSKKVHTSAGKKLSVASSRKIHKNETNFGLKKHVGVDKRKCMDGKWETVMSKIAENKNVKKKFDNVKSKVTSGAVKRNVALKSPPSDDQSVVSTESTGAVAKRNISAVSGNVGGCAKEAPTGSKR